MVANVLGVKYDYEPTSYTTRLINFVIGVTGKSLIKFIIAKKQADAVDAKYHSPIYSKSGPEMVLLVGEEGLTSSVPVPPHVKYTYPYVAIKDDNETPTVEIDRDISDFIESSDKVVIFAFGSLFNPTNETLREVIQFAKSEQKYSFIMAIKNLDFFEEDI